MMSQCVVANIEADAEKNTALSMQYEISSFPTIKFFGRVRLNSSSPHSTHYLSQNAKDTPIDYEGGRTEEDFVEYLNEKCGTHRLPGGGLNEKAGRIESLDDLASQFYLASASARNKIYDQAVLAAESAGEEAKQYLKVMQKVVNSSDEYVVKEFKRCVLDVLDPFDEADEGMV